MATVTTQVLSLGYFSTKLDTNENKAGAENASALNNKTFGSLDNPLWQTRQPMQMTDGNNDGTVSFGGTSLGRNPTDYVEFQTASGLVKRTLDTGALYTAEVTYWDGTKATSNVRVVQDGAGNLYMLPPPSSASQSEISAMTQKPIAMIKITRVVSNSFDGIDTTRIGLPGDPMFACFADDTLIRTPSGERPASSLSVGDKVLTADGSAARIRWIGKRSLEASVLSLLPKLRPIRIRAGALGLNTPASDLLVSPQHRVLIRSKIAERMFGAEEVLVAAKHLTGLTGVDLAEDVESVGYVHFLLEDHQIVFANGAPTESMYTGAQALEMVGPEARNEILSLFPELADPDHVASPARPFVGGTDGRKLVERLAKKLAA